MRYDGSTPYTQQNMKTTLDNLLSADQVGAAMDKLLGRNRAQEPTTFEKKMGVRPARRPMPKLTYYAAPPYDPLRNSKANGGRRWDYTIGWEANWPRNR